MRVAFVSGFRVGTRLQEFGKVGIIIISVGHSIHDFAGINVDTIHISQRLHGYFYRVGVLDGDGTPIVEFSILGDAGDAFALIYFSKFL